MGEHMMMVTHKCWRVEKDEERGLRSEESRVKNRETENAP